LEFALRKPDILLELEAERLELKLEEAALDRLSSVCRIFIYMHPLLSFVVY